MYRTGYKRLLPCLRGLSSRSQAVGASRPANGVIEIAKATSARVMSSSVNLEPFLNGSSGNYVEEMYEAWRVDPKSVHRVRPRLYLCIHLFIFLWSSSWLVAGTRNASSVQFNFLPCSKVLCRRFNKNFWKTNSWKLLLRKFEWEKEKWLEVWTNSS